jgi:hypothetical protein
MYINLISFSLNSIWVPWLSPGTQWASLFINRWYTTVIIIIISLLMSPLLWHRPSLWITHKENGNNPPRRPSADWWELTTAKTADTNGLTCLPKHGEARDINFLVTHPKTNKCCLASVIVTAGPSSSFAYHTTVHLDYTEAVLIRVCVCWRFPSLSRTISQTLSNCEDCT